MNISPEERTILSHMKSDVLYEETALAKLVPQRVIDRMRKRGLLVSHVRNGDGLFDRQWANTNETREFRISNRGKRALACGQVRSLSECLRREQENRERVARWQRWHREEVVS